MRLVRKAVLVTVVFCFIIIGVDAKSGNGGGNNPLEITESLPQNGASDVNVDTDIKLVFSNNVVNMSVKDNNMKCFQLTDKEGNTVDIEVVMEDDQLNKDKRNEVLLKPKTSLQEGKQYIITVSEAMQSKNGDELGKDVTITFSTIGYKDSNAFVFWIIAICAMILISYLLIFRVIKKRS